eukprot:c20628_g1_i1 orf=130-972(+)
MALASAFLPSFADSTRETQSYPCQVSEGRINEQLSCLTYDRLSSSRRQYSSLRTITTVCQLHADGEEKPLKKKMANLCVQRKQIIPLPTHANRSGEPKPLSEFLSQRAGMESMLNTNALQSHEHVGSNTFRCTLPKLEILNFEVAPVVDLSVIANEQECVVEMLSCKFQGSEAVESQNERFSANMRNQLTWDTSSKSDQTLEVNVQLNVSLEVYTLPFTLLPLSAVETPGNAIMQAMVDRMVPVFVDHLLEDYYRWSQTDDALKTSEQAVEDRLYEKRSL